MDKLKTNYQDQTYDTRKYKLTDIGNDERLVEDYTTYTQQGSRFIASDINTRNKTINELITNVEDVAEKLSKVQNGSVAVSKVNRSQTTPYAENATNTDLATKATTADRAISSASFSKDFVLCTKKQLTFTNKVCTINDSNITADSLAEVYFTKDTVEEATKAVPIVDTYNGRVVITVGRDPKKTLVATIKIRKV